MCDYLAGKQDWLAYGLPIEGELAEAVTASQLAVREVPVCHLDDKLSELAPRLRFSGWNQCVVVNEPGIVLGLLRKSMWEGATDGVTAEQAMESAPITFRPYVRREELIPYVEKQKMAAALVTTADGKLLGIVRREDAANAARS